MVKKYTFLILFSVLYLNGMAQNISDDSYGKHLITVNPLFGYASSQIADAGFGVSYEQFLTEYISAKVPLNFGLRTKLWQAGLGVKLYPFGHNRTIKYGVGPSLLFTQSNQGYELSKFDSTGMFFYNEQIDNPLTQLGFVLTNSLNMTINKKIYLGSELGLGLNYVNHYRDELQKGVSLVGNQDPNILFLFTLSMGYRF